MQHRASLKLGHHSRQVPELLDVVLTVRDRLWWFRDMQIGCASCITPYRVMPHVGATAKQQWYIAIFFLPALQLRQLLWLSQLCWQCTIWAR